MDGQGSSNGEQIGMPPAGPANLEPVPPMPEQIGMPPEGLVQPQPESAIVPEIVVPAEIQTDIDAKNAAEEKARADALAAVQPLPPMPEMPIESVAVEAPAPEQIGMPPAAENIPASAPSTSEAIVAANVMGMTQTPEATPTEPVVENKGRFGMGVIETSMPADPSKVLGWTGEVRR